MADTYTGKCTKCEWEDVDICEGLSPAICTACNNGEFFCLCGNEITEDQLEHVGACEECM